MFFRSMIWLICIFVVAATTIDYSDSAIITGTDTEVTDYQLGNDDVGTFTTKPIQEGEETADVDLGDLLDADDNAMVTLVAGQTRIAAHRAVLAARSRTFAAMLHPNALEASGGQVLVPDVEGAVLRQLVAYLYTGRSPRLQQGRAALLLLAAADRYGVPTLKVECERQVADQLNVETAAATAVLAVRHNYQGLQQAAVAFIREHLLAVLATQGWRDAMLSHTQELMRLSQLLSQTTSEHPRCSRPRASAPAACATAPTREVNASSLSNLPAEQKGMRLIEAAKEGTVEELRALLAAGADVAMLDAEFLEVDRMTALHWAAWEGDVEAVRTLLDGGAGVGIRSSMQYTPLQIAAWRGHVAVVRLLLASCADPNTSNKWGWTPLHEAAQYGHAEVAAALLEAGANADVRTDKGETPLDIARQRHHHKLVKMLGCRTQSRQQLSTTTERARRHRRIRL